MWWWTGCGARGRRKRMEGKKNAGEEERGKEEMVVGPTLMHTRTRAR
jgi:hypothetical protein